MIGTKENATRALGNDLPLLSTEGSTRNCYILDDVIYKVDFSDGLTNEAEWGSYQALTKRILPDNVRLPLTNCFRVGNIAVIAMEYIKGDAIAECYCKYSDDTCDSSCMHEKELDLLSDFIDDTYGANVIRVSEGLYSAYYLIDMA